MPDLYPVTVGDMIAEVERELEQRRRLYPVWKQRTTSRVARERMDRQWEVMAAVLEHLKGKQK